jgi:hypothetical protein
LAKPITQPACASRYVQNIGVWRLDAVKDFFEDNPHSVAELVVVMKFAHGTFLSVVFSHEYTTVTIESSHILLVVFKRGVSRVFLLIYCP